MGNHREFDQAKAAAFAGRAMGDASGVAVMVMAYLGDRLNLFKAMADCGPLTGSELAVQANVNARYTEEWLSAMACAGYVDYDPTAATFTLPPEHVPVLAQEAGLYFLGGLYQDLMGVIEPIDQVARAFKVGGGVPQSAFGDKAIVRAGSDDLVLVRELPAPGSGCRRCPDVEAKLQQGGTVAAVTSVPLPA